MTTPRNVRQLEVPLKIDRLAVAVERIARGRGG